MDIIDTKEVAILTGTPESTLRFWRHTNQGPTSFKIGRRVVYRREAVLNWIAQQESATTRGGAA